MKTWIFGALALALLSGCQTRQPGGSAVHDSAHAVRQPFVDVAVNMGSKKNGDLLRLYDSLATAGLRCGIRAMSLGAEQIVVERADFERAKLTAQDIIAREHLTVRVYESADFAESPSSSLLQVWENGRMLRTERYRLYFE